MWYWVHTRFQIPLGGNSITTNQKLLVINLVL